ncbi:Heparinase II/III-like protein [Chitinophaga jiangningensis]|uniref:Heparinase II/III-like protein n=1 Tax=Chitinophaga jiangningensis TaxID=1419482 RepID=A0A1M7AMW9_9BACT|nr:heparinase II/III family protein [Chitinophaga jiangningensis]SHL43987.1 Heparinase II/III-like protein [Chitinophaga jiangningensis]
MKKTLLFFGVLLATVTLQAQNLLSGRYGERELAAKLIPRDKWEPFPSRDNRAVWTTVDPKLAANTIKAAEGYLNYEWPGIPATISMLIVRTGDRRQYQDIANRKRDVLATLMMAEVYENKGRFTDDIINGIWSICEESFWGASAHLPKGKDGGLPDVANPFVELFSAETAELLGWVDYFIGDKLDAASPLIRKRIYDETNRRVFTPLMTNHHGWMGITSSGRRPNNWNPWISSNWLCAVLLLERNEQVRAATVSKILYTLDQFLNPYPQDGGCDEGPGYWSGAAASLYDNICMLNLATNNAFSYVLKDEKVKHMAQFIYKAQISEKYFIDFADADPQPGMNGSLVYRFGKDVGDPDMMKFGAWYIDNDRDGIWRGTYMYYRNFYSLFMKDEFRKAEKGLPLLENVWWPDLEVMTARDNGGTAKGFYVAAKGGNNDESHNHNDVGNFIVYYDGLPVLIDVGRGTYTARTFSGQRYDIWFNRSDFHNLPTVNGYTQPNGPAYKATAVSSTSNKSGSIMKLDLAKAYPAEAGINNWNRTVQLVKKQKVVVEDLVSLKRTDSLTQHLMTCFPAEVTAPGVITIHAEERDYQLNYSSKMKATVEKLVLTKMEDKGIIQKWGDSIYRINLEVVKPAAKEKFVYTITPSKQTASAKGR